MSATSPTGRTAAATEVAGPALVLGWKERVWLPEWDLRLRAKLDTGARSSALHVSSLEELEVDGDGTRVRFDVVLGTRSAPRHHEVEARVVGHRMVRDTRARPERRPVVRTRIRCGPLDTVAEVTLTDRSGMNFRMLLGRLTLEGLALVDPGRGYLVTAPPRPRAPSPAEGPGPGPGARATPGVAGPA